MGTHININNKPSSKTGYKGNNRIYYVYYYQNARPTFSGTLEMCQRYLENHNSTYTVNYSMDHRPYRPEFK